MSEQNVEFYQTLSHTAWGMVPVLCAIGLGVLLGLTWQRWRVRRERIVQFAAVALFLPLLASLWLSVAGVLHVGCAVSVARSGACRTNMQKLGAAMMQYAQDHDETFPPSANWDQAIHPYLPADVSGASAPDPLHCPAARTPGGYGMNRALGTAPMAKMDSPAETVLLFEADAPSRAFAGSASDVSRTRHSGAPNFVFADGRATRFSSLGSTKLWNPSSMTPRP